MGMMAKMRSLAPWFIITVGGLFVLFMVISDSNVLDALGQRSNKLGSINGVEVSYQEFSTLVEQYRANQFQQTSKEVEENQMDLLRDQVWDALVTQRLYEEKVVELGISVTDDEIRDIILGPNPPAFLKQSFIDSAGNFNRELYEAALFDPRNKEALLQAEEGVKQQRIQEKLRSYLNASITVSESEIEMKFIEQNIKMSANYALVDANTLPDSVVNVTQEDLQEYYNENKEDYKTEEQRKIKYVLFRRLPSEGDTLGIKKNLEAIIEDLKEDTSTFKTYVNIYSEQPYSKDTLGAGLLPPESSSALQSAKPGDVVGPILTYEGYLVYKYIDKVRSDENYVRASHILIKSDQDEAQAKEEADNIYNQLIGGIDFYQTAIERSEDKGSAVKGGDLGWFSKGQMVKEFENAAFSGKVGVIQKPVKTNYGYHIIKVTGRSSDKFIIEKIVNKIQPSATTVDKIYNDAVDFEYLADKNGYESEAGMLNYDVMETPVFNKDVVNIPGLGVNKALVKFTFDNSIGTISSVFKVPSGYVVVIVSDVTEKGYKPFEEIEPAIRSIVLRDKKMEKSKEVTKEIKSQISDNQNFESGKNIFPNLKVAVANNFNSSGNIPGVGKEFAFAEYCLKGEINKISEPITGNKGTFLIKITQRSDFDSAAFSIKRNSIRDNLLAQKKNQFFTSWLQGLKDQAEVVDNRYLFYR